MSAGNDARLNPALPEKSAVPVLVLIFNNPVTTAQVMQGLSKIRPTRVYLSADGPRSNISGEHIKCEDSWEIAMKGITWECDIFTRKTPSNQGVKVGVRAAIDWFFANEEQGVVLEHDCVPSQSFFAFAAELLEKYRHDGHIFSICGGNFGYTPPCYEHSYYFSRYVFVWGWATWANRWNKVDVLLEDWHKTRASKEFSLAFQDVRTKNLFRQNLDRVRAGKLDVIDSQMNLTSLMSNSLNVVPSKNLVRNIGFSSHATNTYNPNHWMARLPLEEMDFPLGHPRDIAPIEQAESWFNKNVFEATASRRRRALKATAAVADPSGRLRRWMTRSNIDFFTRKSIP